MYRGSTALRGNESPTQSSPGLLRLPAAARRAGITTALLVHGTKSGTIPVDIIELGHVRPKLYVRAVDFEAWLSGRTKAAA